VDGPSIEPDAAAIDMTLVVCAALDIGGDVSSHRATLCRCGHSQNKPFCDGSHEKSRFTAPGE
jgi:CDGSH-type Zn-finger protein